MGRINEIERRCIYCSPKEPSLAPHTREHVIPQSLGTFENNLVLSNGVCEDCNQYLGNTIDRVLARGSALAIKRFDYGLKEPGEVDQLLKEGFSFELAINHEFDGMKLTLVNQDDEIKV
jgi:hypothetical protein